MLCLCVRSGVQAAELCDFELMCDIRGAAGYQPSGCFHLAALAKSVVIHTFRLSVDMKLLIICKILDFFTNDKNVLHV